MADNGPSEENFLRLFLQYENDLRSYARALCPNWEVVGEVMQEGSVVMWRKLDQLDDERGFLPWAKVIIRYEALKARQTVARDRFCFDNDVFELLAAEDSGPSETEGFNLEREALHCCLSKLDAAQRKMVLLPYRGHGAITRLAEETGRPVNSLYKKIGRLREKLTKCIEGELGGSNPRKGIA